MKKRQMYEKVVRLDEAMNMEWELHKLAQKFQDEISWKVQERTRIEQSGSPHYMTDSDRMTKDIQALQAKVTGVQAAIQAIVTRQGELKSHVEGS